MNKRNIDISKLSTEQKVVLHLAKKGYLTAAGDIQRALIDQPYAEKLVLGLDMGVNDLDCTHEALSNEEIQEVFDNDYE